MQVPDFAQDFLILIPFLILGEGVVAAIIWQTGGKGGPRGRFAAWLGLTTLTVCIGTAIAFIVLHGLFFLIGPTAAMAGALVTTVFMLTMPIGWAYVVRRGAPGRDPSRT